jgi:two-component system sensor histidine kinase SenX3
MFTRDGRALPLHERPMFRALSEGTATTDERFVVERPDGRRIVVEISAVPFRDPGGADSVVVTIEDVTEREKLERAERDFVTNSAHELQTPLAAIVSAVEVLQSGAKERPEDRDRFLQHIADASGRLEQLTRALLLLARAEIGDRVRTEVVALAPLLESIVASSRDRELRIECADDLGVLGNGTLLGHALASLVDNAVKHTRSAVVIAAEPEADRVRISVRDRGTGIPEADRERVFERFYRGEGVTQEGSGLGLAIVAAASRALGGEVELESSGAGTSVSLVLPAARLVSR